MVDQLPLPSPSTKVEEVIEIVAADSTPVVEQEAAEGVAVTEDLVVLESVVLTAQVPVVQLEPKAEEAELVGESAPPYCTSTDDVFVVEEPVASAVAAAPLPPLTASIETQEVAVAVVIDSSAVLDNSNADQLIATNDEVSPKGKEEEEVHEETVVPVAVNEQLAGPTELNQENSHEDCVNGGEHETQPTETETTTTSTQQENLNTEQQQQQVEPQPEAVQEIPDQNHVDQSVEVTEAEATVDVVVSDEKNRELVVEAEAENVVVEAEETPLLSSQPPAEEQVQEEKENEMTSTTEDHSAAAAADVVVVLQVPQGDVMTVGEDAAAVKLEVNGLNNGTQAATPEALAVEALLISVGLIDDQPAAVEVEVPELVAAVLVNGSVEGEPSKQVEEVLVQAEQVEKLSASTPRLDVDGQTMKSGKKTASESGRKPEWMRRPLVRKGSVGRFLGRMKETMQSKRFGPERLPVTVPPPEPEPPKRPPRRKTLANLDLSRESVSVATSREYSQLDSAPPPPKDATPVRDPLPAMDKSATLRSTTSERRKRTNSVGRFIGRVLSTKHLNTADGSPEETAPLQPAPAESQSTPPAPTTPSATPEKTSKVKEQVNQAKEQVNKAKEHVNQVIRRILRPVNKTSGSVDETKTKSVPERPPPPSRQRSPSPSAEKASKKEKPIVKSGKVQFHCQVIKSINVCTHQ